MGKGLYAQLLADRLEQGDCVFAVPRYIQQAICWACAIAEEESE